MDDDQRSVVSTTALVYGYISSDRPQDAHRLTMTAMTPASTPLTAPPPSEFRGVFRDDLAARGVYAEAAGIARVMPRAVAVPAGADDVVTLVRWAQAAGQALVPRGSGSSMPSGAI